MIPRVCGNSGQCKLTTSASDNHAHPHRYRDLAHVRFGDFPCTATRRFVSQEETRQPSSSPQYRLIGSDSVICRISVICPKRKRRL